MLGLDNAYISFTNFRCPRTALLSRFANVSPDGRYTLQLPDGCKRMMDLLVSRLMTGRICLSEGTIAHALAVIRHNWSFVCKRRLWSKQGGERVMSQLVRMMFLAFLYIWRFDISIYRINLLMQPLVRHHFVERARSVAVVARFIATTRARVAEAVATDVFPDELVEATCMWCEHSPNQSTVCLLTSLVLWPQQVRRDSFRGRRYLGYSEANGITRSVR